MKKTVATMLILAGAHMMGLGLNPPPPPAGQAEGRTKGVEPANSAEIARSLPQIPPADGVVTLPLTADGALAWRGIRPGVTVTATPAAGADQPAAVRVAYTRTRNQPAGAALLIRPGTLAGLKQLNIQLKSTRTQRLSVTLKDTAGVVWTFPTINARADQDTVQSLDAADIEPDAYQNTGRVTAKFDAATVMMVTMLDIGGYMSLDEPACEWSLTGAKAVCK